MDSGFHPACPRTARLSEEVLDQICRHLNQASLLSLCLVSKLWLPSSTKRLFYNPVLSIDGKMTTWYWSRGLHLLKTLKENPVLANHVRCVDKTHLLSNYIALPQNYWLKIRQEGWEVSGESGGWSWEFRLVECCPRLRELVISALNSNQVRLWMIIIEKLEPTIRCLSIHQREPRAFRSLCDLSRLLVTSGPYRRLQHLSLNALESDDQQQVNNQLRALQQSPLQQIHPLSLEELDIRSENPRSWIPLLRLTSFQPELLQTLSVYSAYLHQVEPKVLADLFIFLQGCPLLHSFSIVWSAFRVPPGSTVDTPSIPATIFRSLPKLCSLTLNVPGSFVPESFIAIDDCFPNLVELDLKNVTWVVESQRRFHQPPAKRQIEAALQNRFKSLNSLNLGGFPSEWWSDELEQIRRDRGLRMERSTDFDN